MRVPRGWQRCAGSWCALFAVVALAACGGSSNVASDADKPLLLAPSELPSGWFVANAAAVRRDAGEPVQTLYSRPGFGPERDAALLVAETGEDTDVAYPDLDAPTVANLGPVPEAPPARIEQFGDYTVVGWYRATERTTFVIGRGLSDEEVVRAARAAVIEDDVTPTIAASGLPHGFEKVASAGLLPREGGAARQEISLIDAHVHSIRISMSDLDAGARAVDAFLSRYPGAREAEVSSERTVEGRNVFVRGDAPASVVDALARSVSRVSAAGWNAFRRRVLDLPVSVMFARCSSFRNTVIVDGLRHGVRWAIAMSDVPDGAIAPCSGMVQFAVDGDNAPGGDSDQVWSTPAAVNTHGSIEVRFRLDESSGSEHALTVGGSVSAATARVTVRAGEQLVVATMSNRTPASRRYFGAYLDGLPPPTPRTIVTAYAADGHELERWISDPAP